MQELLGGIVGGLVMGAVMLALTLRFRANAVGAVALAVGAIAFSFTVAGFASPALGQYPLLSVVPAFATVVVAIGAVVQGQRSWMTWAGLVMGGLPALFWLAFPVAEILWPH